MSYDYISIQRHTVLVHYQIVRRVAAVLGAGQPGGAEAHYYALVYRTFHDATHVTPTSPAMCIPIWREAVQAVVDDDCHDLMEDEIEYLRRVLKTDPGEAVAIPFP